jgi:hypothetical protein
VSLTRHRRSRLAAARLDGGDPADAIDDHVHIDHLPGHMVTW